MKMHRFVWPLLTGLALTLSICWPLSVDAAGQPKIRRFALIAGSNNGGTDRVLLRYAHADARSVARVMKNLGGLSSADMLILMEPRRDQLKASLQTMRQQIRSARSQGTRIELFFYYSGHSDERGLLLEGEHFTYLEIRQAIQTLGADVLIAVLDSCASGSLTRSKGGRRRPSFLVDSSGEVRGHAFLTSASADEAAQESDRVRGSFFTHYLVSGLRGAADANRDRLVTLNEAYHYAFHETLARTETTQAGPQHPNYDMQLAGSGDLVLTDLRGTSALLVLDGAISGRLFIRDTEGRLVAEINKHAGHPLVLGLEPSTYHLTLEGKEHVYRSTVQLKQQARTLVTLSSFSISEEKQPTVRRGATPAVASAAPVPPPEKATFSYVPFQFSLLPIYGPRNVRTSFSLALLASYYAQLRGVDISLGASVITESIYGAQISLAFNYAGTDVRGTQLSVGGNYAGCDVRGVQGSVGFNFTGQDHLSGGQLAAGFNITQRDMFGTQASVGFNYAGGDMTGAQVAAGFNLTEGLMDGTQLAVGANLSRDVVDGVQLAAGGNSAPEVNGAQISSGINHAGLIYGSQIGMINLAGEVQGVQLGLINVANRVSKVQIGLVNIANKSPVSISLLNLIKDGIHNLELWSADSSVANLGLKLGGKYVYSLLALGIQPKEQQKRWMYGLGVGGRFPLGRFYADLDVIHYQINENFTWTADVNHLDSLRLILGWELHSHFALFVGGSFNVLTTRVGDGTDFGLFHGWKVHDGQTIVRLWPGFLAGLRI